MSTMSVLAESRSENSAEKATMGGATLLVGGRTLDRIERYGERGQEVLGQHWVMRKMA